MRALITIVELAAALHCTDRNIRDRELRGTLPRHIDDETPAPADVDLKRQYRLDEVLLAVDGQERNAICRYLRITTQLVVRQKTIGDAVVREEPSRDPLNF